MSTAGGAPAQQALIRATLRDAAGSTGSDGDGDGLGFHAEAPEILPTDIIFGQELAKGNFGTVYKGRCRGEIVAIKELHEMDNEALGEFKTEVAIMSCALIDSDKLNSWFLIFSFPFVRLGCWFLFFLLFWASFRAIWVAPFFPLF